jgi:hypothetical protein
MDYHWDFDLKEGDIVCIENHRPMNIMLLNDEEYQRHKTVGGVYHYQNHLDVSPIRIPILSTGHWHIVITGDEGKTPPRVRTRKGN